MALGQAEGAAPLGCSPPLPLLVSHHVKRRHGRRPPILIKRHGEEVGRRDVAPSPVTLSSASITTSASCRTSTGWLRVSPRAAVKTAWSDSAAAGCLARCILGRPAGASNRPDATESQGGPIHPVPYPSGLATAVTPSGTTADQSLRARARPAARAFLPRASRGKARCGVGADRGARVSIRLPASVLRSAPAAPRRHGGAAGGGLSVRDRRLHP